MAKNKPTGVSVPHRINKEIKKTGAGSNQKGKDAAKLSIDQYSKKLLAKAKKLSDHAGRKRITDEDIRLAEEQLLVNKRC